MEKKNIISLNSWVILIVGYYFGGVFWEIFTKKQVQYDLISHSIASIINATVFLFVFLKIFSKKELNIKSILLYWFKYTKRDFIVAFVFGFLITIIGILMFKWGVAGSFTKPGSVKIAEELSNLRINKAYFKLLLYFSSYCLFTPVIEEIFFTRLLYVSLRNKFNLVKALTYTSGVFALFHPSAMVYIFFCGLFHFYLYEKFQRLQITLMLHFFYNFFALMFLLFA